MGLVLRSAIGLALFALATSADASTWRKVGESSSVGDLLADMDSVKRTGDTVSVWLQWPNYHSNYEPRVASASERAEFYCGAREFQLFEMIVRDKGGHVLFNMTDDDGRAVVQPDTVFGRAFEILCGAGPNGR
jgi:hypothetical protein